MSKHVDGKKYLTILCVTHPMQQSGCRGESDGNGTQLQITTLGESIHTVLTGPSLRYAIRKAIQDMEAFPMWRKVEEDGEFRYGSNEDLTMAEAFNKHNNDIAELIKQYADVVLFGTMVNALGNTKKMAQRRSAVQVSMALSGDPFQYDSIFGKGQKSQGKKAKDGVVDASEAEGALYTYQTHHSRYAFTLTFDLATIAAAGRIPEISQVLNTILGLQVGGNQSACLSEVIPEMLAWRMYNVAGQSGLFASPTELDYRVGKPLSAEGILKQARDLGRNVNIAGLAVCDSTVAEGLQDIQECVRAAWLEA